MRSSPSFIVLHLAAFGPLAVLAQDPVTYSGFGNNGFSVVENYAAPGDLGLVHYNEQPDGKILVTGFHGAEPEVRQFFVQRLNADGTMDEGFANYGRFLGPDTIPGFGSFAGIARNDGTILLVGGQSYQGHYALILMQLHADGTVDTSFGDAGMAIHEATASMAIHDSHVAPDGSVFIAGQLGSWPFLAKVQEDGSFDPAFGIDGYVLLDNAPFHSTCAEFEIAAQGYLVLACNERSWITKRWYLTALDMTGAAAPWFGDNGFRVVDRYDLELEEYCTDLALFPDGSMITSGFSRHDGASFLSYAAFDPYGSPSSSFGATGLIELQNTPGLYQEPGAISLLPDGDLLFSSAQWGSSGFDSKTRMVRLNADGSLEESFGEGGVFLHYRPNKAFTNGRMGGLLSNGRLAIVGPIMTAAGLKHAVAVFDLGDLSTNSSAIAPPANSISLFPNPASTSFTLQGIDRNAVVELTLLDAEGRWAHTWSRTGSCMLEYDLPGSIVSGTYTVAVRSGNMVMHRALHVQR